MNDKMVRSAIEALRSSEPDFVYVELVSKEKEVNDMASSDFLQFLPLSIIMDAQKMTELSHIRFEEEYKKIKEGYKRANEEYVKYRNNVIKNGGRNV